ncbi:hypothetical protein N7495_008332 [Penicillium taxi]|uniref:uncharacterized protein n=1 Tax=Penicillium taxi TaxID=168475 RepID=UPI002545881F|nr:uncharacterized protein N7495_008332 [Penicillium taxi]KAJ5888291.1 hypothetical protein N7495_008332 [Penicillium taxi]
METTGRYLRVPALNSDFRPTADNSLVTCHGKHCWWCWKETEEEARVEIQQEVEQETLAEEKGESILRLLSALTAQDVPQPGIESNMNRADTPHEGILGHCTSEDRPPLPPILYRWSNIWSQGINEPNSLVAGLFQSVDSEQFTPYQLSREQFLRHFKNHVTKQKVSTPFISTSQMPVTPIHRALHNQEDAIVFIIDTAKLDTPVIKAQTLVPLTGTETPHWRGYGEYLIWGQVPREAIVCSFKIIDLEKIAGLSDDIGEFLQLELIKSHKYCSRNLYMALTAGQTRSNHHITLELLSLQLKVPVPQRDKVESDFLRAWSERGSLFISRRQQVAEGSREPPIRSLNPVLHSQLGNTSASTSSYEPHSKEDELETRQTETRLQPPEVTTDSRYEAASDSSSVRDFPNLEEGVITKGYRAGRHTVNAPYTPSTSSSAMRANIRGTDRPGTNEQNSINLLSEEESGMESGWGSMDDEIYMEQPISFFPRQQCKTMRGQWDHREKYGIVARIVAPFELDKTGMD